MSAYVDETYYISVYGGVTNDHIEREIRDASNDIDTMTYNRIIAIGFANLSDYQQGAVKEVVCALIDFKRAYADAIDTPYSSYANNGVSISFGKTDTVTTVQGIMIPIRLYKRLVSSGLCCLGVQ